ncbi:hypothetical protein OIU78_026199 [Salix suchowensis]|nr:hypothetical protein OIU78_026199 [Salix suchowensis]
MVALKPAYLDKTDCSKDLKRTETKLSTRGPFPKAIKVSFTVSFPDISSKAFILWYIRGSDMVIIDAAKQIMTVLRSRKNLTDEEKEILGDLHAQLTTAIAVSEKEVDEIHRIEERLNVIQGKVMCWERYWPMIWDSGLDEATEYLNAADEARQMTKKLEILCLTEDREKEMLRRAKNLLQISMKRLGEKFKHMLTKNRQPFEPKHVPVFSIADSAVSEISLDNKVVEDSTQRKIINRNAEEFTINLVRHDVIPELRRIANVMSISGYADECSVAYIGIQSSALVENLRILEKEKLRTEDVLKLEQVSLKSKINRRIQTMKMFLRVYLASDKWLSEQIFGELGTVNLASFTEPLVVQLLKYFDEAISTGPKNPGNLFHLLDMYEVLAGLLPYLDSLYCDKGISQEIVDGDMVLRGLADSARKTLDEFEGSIMTYGMSETFAAEGIHPLTKYVMNYISALTGYHEILDSLLNDHCGDHPLPASSCTSPGVEEGNISGGTCDFSPIARHFLSNNSIRKWLSNGFSASPSTKEESISGGTCKLSRMALEFQAFCCILESQLYDKAKLFKDACLKHVFLMNNMHYMVQTVENSELQFILGEEWIREHNWEFQQHVMNCKSVTWSPVLSLTSNSENEFDDEGRLNVIQEKIMSWETYQSMHWDFGPNEANEYINSADELQKLIEKLEAMCLKDDGEKELLRRAHDVLQIAMARLVEEFKHMLIQKRQPFEPEHMYFRSSEDDAGSVISLGDESFKESQPRDSASRNSEEYIVDLVHPVTIPELRRIANLMFISGYGHECSQAYVSVRRDVFG